MLCNKAKQKNMCVSGNGDEFPDFADLLFFFGIKNVRVSGKNFFFRVGWSIGNTHIFLFGLIT
jgi:hypothetical protein